MCNTKVSERIMDSVCSLRLNLAILVQPFESIGENRIGQNTLLE